MRRTGHLRTGQATPVVLTAVSELPRPDPINRPQVRVEEIRRGIVTQFIDTIDQLFAVPRGTVVYSKAGTIAARFDLDHGVVFGDERPIPWRDLALPASVLWSPNQESPQWDPPPAPDIDDFEQLLDLPAGSAIRTKFAHPDGHRVYEKFPDGRWKAAGSGRHTPVDRLETMLPARLIWHPEWR